MMISQSKKQKGGGTLKLLLLICALTVVIFGAFVADVMTDGKNAAIMYDEKLLSFEAQWDIDIDGLPAAQGVRLPHYIRAEKGEKVSMSALLPKGLSDGTYFAYKSVNSFSAVYIDDTQIYHGRNSFQINGNERVVSAWNFVPLSSEYSGKRLTVVFENPYAHDSGVLPDVMTGTHSEVLMYASSTAATAQKLGFSIVILGVLVFLFSLVSVNDEKSSDGFVSLGIAVAVMGLTVIADSCIPRASLDAYIYDYLLAHISSRILPLLYLLYVQNKSPYSARRIYRRLFVLGCVNFVGCSILNFVSPIDFYVTLGLSNILTTVVLGMSLYHALRKGSGRSRAYKILMTAGIGSYVVCIAFDYFTHEAHLLNMKVSFTVIGALIFALLQTVTALISAYERMSGQLVMQKEYNKSKIKLMISQIQPHFIYNSLSTIRIMIRHDPDKAYKMIYDFSGYLSYNFNSIENVPLVPFSEELKHIKTYTAIEEERFFDRIKIVYDIGSEKFTVPPLSIQPFVENAIKHGVCEELDGGSVIVKSYEIADCYVVQIVDDGAGFDVGFLKGKKGIGIKNASYRLEALANASVDIKSKINSGTTVTITVPKTRRSADDENHFG